MKPRLTFDEHAELGHALASIRDELLHRTTQLHNAYPRTGQSAVPGKLLKDATEAIDAARVKLERELNEEHPELAQPSVYYPIRED
ncbi:hypothetical protein [Actinomadura litoris]|uniref:hypothetical protein n=1 Tax=Actinomadura litoris TaxID=2678616 RepID=UPI001FA6B944|nr:hypothetical protein [Actinomadura litoris]